LNYVLLYLTPLALPPTHLLSYSYHHHLPLHSFPTRRSSDLSSAARFSRPACCSSPAHSSRTIRWRRRPARRSRRCSMTRTSSSRDRKSTRLNSSHDQISYAVFCLKKKKKYQISKYIIICI